MDEPVIFEALDRHTPAEVTVALMLARSDCASTVALLRLGTLLQSPRVVRLMQSIPLRPVTIKSSADSAKISHFRFTALIWQFMTCTLPLPSKALGGSRTFPTLTAFVAHAPLLFERDVQRLICCVLQGLHVIHGEGLAYRGWSTEHLMLLAQSPHDLASVSACCASLKLVVTHGSCSVRAEGTGPVDSLLVRDGFGTVRFLAPEVVDVCFRPEKPLDTPGGGGSSLSYAAAKADVWAVGVLMHMLLFGSFWQAASARPETAEKGNGDEWGRLRLLRAIARSPSFSRHYDPQSCDPSQPSPAAFRLLARLLERDPSKRPSVKECLADAWILQLSPPSLKAMVVSAAAAAPQVSSVDEKASLVATISFFQKLHQQYESERQRRPSTPHNNMLRCKSVFSARTSDRAPFPFGTNTAIRIRYERNCAARRVKPNSQLLEMWTVANQPLHVIDLSDNPIGSAGLSILLETMRGGAECGECAVSTLYLSRCGFGDRDVHLIGDSVAAGGEWRRHLHQIVLDGSPLVSSGAVRRLITTMRRASAGAPKRYSPVVVSFADCPGVTPKLAAIAKGGL